MDYSKLKPIDDNVKHGDALLYWYSDADMGDPEPFTFIHGQDSEGYFVGLDGDGEYRFGTEPGLWYAPLCWVEDRPVYKGDVLYRNDAGEKRTVVSYDGEWFDTEEGASVRPSYLTWEKPSLCTIEDRPVCRGDVLWYKGDDFSMRVTGYNPRVKDNSGLEGVIVDGGASYRAGDEMWAPIMSWTWTKPKTKKQAWAVFKPVEDSTTGLMALPYPYSSREAAEIAFPDYHICLIEWEV